MTRAAQRWAEALHPEPAEQLGDTAPGALDALPPLDAAPRDDHAERAAYTEGLRDGRMAGLCWGICLTAVVCGAAYWGGR